MRNPRRFSSVLRLTASGFACKLVALSVRHILFTALPSNCDHCSGPGAVSPDFVWIMAPATDLLVPELQDMLATSAASALKEAEDSMAPAVVGLGSSQLFNVTVNRRADISPYVQPDSIDPHLGVIRVDRPDGTPLVTLWNYAIHGMSAVCCPARYIAIPCRACFCRASARLTARPLIYRHVLGS